MNNIKYAGFWRRFAAVFIDVLILVIPQSLFGYIFGMAFVNRSAALNPLHNIIGYELWSRGVALGIAWLYFAILESSKYQATIGKMALGIIVTDTDGRRISFGRASGRFFGKILSAIALCLGYIMAGVTSRKQALHDILARCLVVSKPVRTSAFYATDAIYEPGDDEFFLTAQKEIDAGTTHDGLWAKAFQLHPDNENYRRAAYLKLRVSHLRAEKLASLPTPPPFFQTNIGRKLKELIPLWIIVCIGLIISIIAYFNSWTWRDHKEQFIAARYKAEEAKWNWDAVVRAGRYSYVHVVYTVNGIDKHSYNHEMIAYRDSSIRCYDSTNSPFDKPVCAMDGVNNIRAWKGDRIQE